GRKANPGQQSVPAARPPLTDAQILGELALAAEANRWPAGADPIGCVDRLIADGKASFALLAARRLVAARPGDGALRLAVAHRLRAQMDTAGVRALAEPLLSDAN